MKMRMTRSDTLRSDANTPSGKAEEWYQKVMETQKVMESNPSGIAEERYRKDERKREEMAGKRLQTLANVMAMEMISTPPPRKRGGACGPPGGVADCRRLQKIIIINFCADVM